jgi:nucleoid-associated protein YgaU
MKRSFKYAVSTIFAFCLIQYGGLGCSSDQQQLEDPLLVEEGEENNGENFGNENLANENFGNENFANDQFAQENAGAFENQDGQNFANDQFNSLGGENPLLANDNQANNDLENIIEEINNASQGDGSLSNVVEQGVGGNEEISNAVVEQDANTTLVGTPLAPGLPELGSKMSYIVKPGDTLVAIAQKIYGDGNQWTEIANFTGLANPRLIYPGDVVYYQLTQQTQSFASAYESVQRTEIQVQQGDTLSRIAGRVLGDPSKWKMIWRQNDNIDNPDELTAGTTIFYVEPGMLSSALEIFKNHFRDLDQTKVTQHSKVEKNHELTAFDTDLADINLQETMGHIAPSDLDAPDSVVMVKNNGKNVI